MPSETHKAGLILPNRARCPPIGSLGLRLEGPSRVVRRNQVYIQASRRSTDQPPPRVPSQAGGGSRPTLTLGIWRWNLRT